METYKLVLPEYLNHYGYLFGGQLLKWVDEAAYIAARLDYPACEFVTVAMDRLAFNERVELGSILRFEVHRTRIGRTSVNYVATARNALAKPEQIKELFSTNITFVRIGPDGEKQLLPVSGQTEPASRQEHTGGP
ncbi:MAG: acyl-CoA thioesterase [Magnetococcus sp. DMHC-8]